ncbi:FxLYD domain-containing protein [Chengkuizengella sp. SCS-71B]|uniref:FxLYD domain-containing protein n=1 Tax=Chengkuizengella sp. SCS-71B TaxID=3115290 RepID=UPI0032C240A7
MKINKILVLCLIGMISIFFVACSNGEHAGEAVQTTTETNNEGNEETSEQPEETSKEVEEAVNLEITQSTGEAWEDSIGTIWVNSAAVFENKGNVPVKINEAQMNFKDQEGGILGTAQMIYATPEVVLPGETAYIVESTILEGIESAEAFKETSFNFGFDETDESPNLLEVSGVKGIIGDEYTRYLVTGLVKNTTEEKQENIEIAAGLFAEDGSLIGVLVGTIDVGVNPGGEAGFELSYPELPAGIDFETVSTIDVKAYGWDW